ncbi:MAG: hypothetical protein LUG98_16145, partial [Tannerellaceae bacterium]|nr:hypothetical protein [Tannerellaceae bacterium]
VILFFICSFPLFSQNQGYMYESYTDVLTGHVATVLPDLQIHRRTTNQVWSSGNREYKIFTEDKATNKKIKKEFAAILINDTLYLNTHKLKCKRKSFGNGHVYAFAAVGSLFFKTYPLPSDGAVLLSSLTGGIGAGIESANRIKKSAYYEMNPENKKIVLIKVDRLKELLADYPELLSDLEREDPNIPKQELVNAYMELWREQVTDTI